MFELVRDLVREVVDVDPGAVGAPGSAELCAEDLLDRIAACERLKNAIDAEQARDIAAFVAARETHDKETGVTGALRGRTVATELALATGVATKTAERRCAVAVAAVTDHPGLLALLVTGRVSMAGLVKAVRETAVLPSEQRRVVDAQLVLDAVADRLTPGMLERAARRRTQAADPAAADTRAARERADRRIHLMGKPDGVGVLWLKLRAEEAAAVYTTLDAQARAMRADGDERSLQDLMCDLLVEFITDHPMKRVDSSPVVPAPEPAAPAQPAPAPPAEAKEPRLPDPGPWRIPTAEWKPSEALVPDPEPWDISVPDPYQDDVGPPATERPPPQRPVWRMPTRVEVQVVMSAATLLGLDDEPAMLRGYGAIPREVVHEIMDSAESTALRGLFCDPVDGRLVAMDAKTRCFVGGLRQFEMFRDQRCRLTDGRIVDIDHIVPVADGGPTTAANGEGLSKNSHVVKDHPGVTVRTKPPQQGGDRLDGFRVHAPDVTWTLPTGRSYRFPPPPVLDWGSRPTPFTAPPLRDTKELVDEVRTMIEQPRSRTDDRTSRQQRRRAARKQRRAARLELAAWRRSHELSDNRRRAAQRRRQQRAEAA